MVTARKALEQELMRLRSQRERYRMAAYATTDRKIALRRLLSLERLEVEIAAREVAIAAISEQAPIEVELVHTDAITLH